MIICQPQPEHEVIQCDRAATLDRLRPLHGFGRPSAAGALDGREKVERGQLTLRG